MTTTITTRCAGSDCIVGRVDLDTLNEERTLTFDPLCSSCGQHVEVYSDFTNIRLREHRRTLTPEELQYEMDRGMEHMEDGS